MKPILPEKFAKELLKAHVHDVSFIRKLMSNADNANISTSKLFGYARVTNAHAQQVQSSLSRMREELQMQTRQELRMKEHERVIWPFKLAVIFTVLCIIGAFVSLFFKPWLFNFIFVPTILIFSGWSMWYTHRRLRHMQARWIYENLQRRVGTENK